jgi:hypothetical protein
LFLAIQLFATLQSDEWLLSMHFERMFIQAEGDLVMSREIDDENEERRQPGVSRMYRNNQIAVSWEPKLCIHAGNCFRNLQDVFQPQSTMDLD